MRFSVLLLCLVHSGLFAAVPGIISYQGRVSVGATAFTGTGQFRFALVNADGTTTFWSNDGTSTAGSQPTAAVSLPVNNGLYAVLLGDTSVTGITQSIPASVFSNTDVRLRVWFNDGTANGVQQLSPDQRIASVGFSLSAASVNGGTGTFSSNSSTATLSVSQSGSGTAIAGTGVGTGFGVVGTSNGGSAGVLGVANGSADAIVANNLGSSGNIASFSRNNVAAAAISNTGVYQQLSDVRRKEKVATLKNASKVLRALRGVEFDWNLSSKSEDVKHDVGFIAQEVLAVMPEAVRKGADGYYMVSYTKFVPLLVEGFKEIERRREDLETEVEQLQKQNDALMNRLSRLEQLLETKNLKN